MNSTTIFLLFFVSSFFDGISSKSDNGYKIVKISSGNVKGYKQDDVYEFYGIPYATAPTGIHKFKAPLPAPIWHDTLDATVTNLACPQNIEFFKVLNIPTEISSVLKFTENCLIANVFVPSVSNNKTLPVAVFVHGGAYQIGTGNIIKPTDITKQGELISVTFNYRLGVHGFLCLGTEDIPGNAGMKDMVALLRWVKENIASFGGNPDDVTIIGHSAGAAAVDLLMLSESASGLFNKVIPESGNALGPWSFQIDPLENAKSYAKQFNFTKTDIYDLEVFYKTTPLHNLTSFISKELTDNTFKIGPCIERHTEAESFLNDSPFEIIKRGEFKKVPYLIGVTNMDGLVRAPLYDVWRNGMNENFTDFLPGGLAFNSLEEKYMVAKEVKKFYFGNNNNEEENKRSFFEYMTDIMFAFPVVRAIDIIVKTGSDSVYFYEFTYTDETVPGPFTELKGAHHCSQTMALYKNVVLPYNESTLSDNFKIVRNTLRNIWINFIKTGKPVTNASDLVPSGWPAVSSNGFPYMDINLVPRVISSPLHKERIELWDKIYQKYYRAPVPPTE